MRALVLLGTVSLLYGCGSGAAQADERSAAIQAALDAKPPAATVYAGFVCLTYGAYPKGNPERYAGIPGAPSVQS
jgi:hypothetical protein